MQSQTKRGDTNASIANTFDKNTYDLCLKNLGNNKAPGPDNIPNSILKNMPIIYYTSYFTNATNNNKFQPHGKLV
jgi:hypothetical protein